MYFEEEGVIKERFPDRWFVHSVSHIESVPFFHVYPGSRSLVFGTAGGSVPAITDICGLIEARLQERPVALILVEGVGISDFPLAYQPCLNGKKWYYYEPGEGQ
jgi:hypothetical protein